MRVIVTGKKMPNQWNDCRFNYECECCLIDAVCSDEMSENGVDRPHFCPLKSIDGLIDRIEQAKQYKGESGNPHIDVHDVGLDRYFDLGLDKAIKIIKEYCEVEK